MDEKVHARHLAQLGFLKRILEEAELSVTMLEKSELLPIHILMAGFRQDGEGRDRFLHFSFLPLGDDELESLQLLQIYFTFPFAMKPECRQELALLLLDVNTRLPIGHIGVSDRDEIHYRYIYALSASETFKEDETLDIVQLFVHMCDMFAEPLEQVANGSLPASEAVGLIR